MSEISSEASTTENYYTHKKYFKLKKLVGLRPQLDLLAVFIRKSGHDNMFETMQPHTESMSTHTVSLRHGHTNTLHTFSFL